MAETLTYEQQQAVSNRGGKLLVSAAAGSGKTKVLVDRLMGYILDANDPANIDDFLVITYTKAAAAELRGKIAAKISELIAANPGNKHLHQQMQRLYLAKISTVHGFCGDILRQYAYRLDITADFRVADESECLQLQLKAMEQVLDSAYETAAENPDFCAFIDSQGLGRNDKQIPEILLKVYHSARCHLHPDRWLDWCTNGDTENIADVGQTPWGSYLIADLKAYVSMQIDALQRCVTAGSQATEMEKPVALLSATISQLQNFIDSNTWDEIAENKGIDYGRLSFSKKITDIQLSEQIKAVRSACKDGMSKRLRSFASKSCEIVRDMETTLGAARGLVSLVRAFSGAYEALKKSRNILDFGDLEHRTLDLLLGKQRSTATVVASEIGKQFREIMVDEYQDSNEIQDAIFSALTGNRQNCFMVGDVKQSIYQFRLADPGIFIDKYNAYQPAESAKAGEGRKVVLSHNFRSSGGVIEGVNAVFAQCMSPNVGGLDYGYEEMLKEGNAHVSLNEPEVSLYGIDVVNDTYTEEASFVANKIASLLDGTHLVRQKDSLRPIQPEDIVILLRSPGSVGAAFQYALQSKGIPCTTGDSADLLETQEVSTVRAILQVVDNPVQDIPLTALLTSPVFCFTAEDLAELRSSDRYGCMYNLVNSSDNKKCRDFMEILNKLRMTARISTVTQLLTAIYTDTNLLSIYSAMDDGDVRLNNLQTFFQTVSEFESAGSKGLSRLLEFLDGAQNRGMTGTAGQQNKGAVTLMSIHKSKGLEFPVVFLCGLSRGFNQESARAQVLCHKDLGLGLGCVDTKLRVRYPTIGKRAIGAKIMQESISEELRVLYVAMTRARDRLFMTYAVKNLADNLQEIAMRLDMCSGELLASEVTCPGEWVLQTALKRSEAGAFFALGGHPNCANVSEIPWEISVVEAEITEAAKPCMEEFPQERISRETLEKLSSGLHFVYKNIEATKIPSKLTATQLKGRVLDNEIAEGTNSARKVEFRKPSAVDTTSGTSYGNTIHAVMQYIDYAMCTNISDIELDVQRMVRERLVSAQQAEGVDCEKLLLFFETPLGTKLRTCQQVIREFKFSLLVDASKYYPDAQDEKVLLQGVVDCAIIEDDGITVLDFKTDRVTDQTITAVSEKYKAQVMAYADALARIYEKPIKSAVLYFFKLNRFVEVI